VVCAAELAGDQKIKRVYALNIEGYSNRSLKSIFEQYISKEANLKQTSGKGISHWPKIII